jgi:membrane protein
MSHSPSSPASRTAPQSSATSPQRPASDPSNAAPTSRTGSRWTRAQTRDLLHFVMRRLREERLPEVAGSLTFTTVLALVPVLTIAFAIFTTFPLFTTFRDSLEAYFVQSLMPKGIANTILDYLSQFSAKASRLSALGAIFLIVTAVMMFGTVDRTLNRIWRVQTTRPFVQRMVIYWAVMSFGPLLIGASVTAASELLPMTASGARDWQWLRASFTLLVSITLSTLAFALLYLTVPNRFVDWREAMTGGLVAAIGFEITRRGFAFAINLGGGYRAIYGALSAVPVFLIWVYLFWLITLLGAAVAAALPVVRYERWWHRAAPGSAFLDAMAIIKVLVDARAGHGAVDALKIRELTHLGFEESEALLQRMLEAGWVGRIRAERQPGLQLRRRSQLRQERWAWLANPAKLTLAEVFRRFAFEPLSDSTLAGRVGRVMDQGLVMTLADYFSSADASA